jgi:hypothetical protein
MKRCMTSRKNSKIAGGKKINTSSSTHNTTTNDLIPPKKERLAQKEKSLQHKTGQVTYKIRK